MKSFGILRTNVGLTTNVKVVVDGKYGLSLDSIDSAADLSSSKFKKFGFNKDNYYDELLPKFWGGLPAELAFQIKYEEDSTSMTDNFSSQYDEIYQYGARNIVNNKSYSEEFEYFAPLYVMKGNLPKNFIVFRVDGPGMLSLNRYNIRSEVFSKFKVVKLFDLGKQTPLGEWLDKNINGNEFFPDSPFSLSFTRLEFSSWNGIDYSTGGYVNRSLFLEDVLEEEKEIFEMEKFVFDGYRKNRVVFPNILNMSFLFDDTPATADSLRKWSINRYYGFYLDGMDRISTISPYITPFLKQDVIVKAGNILHSESGDPFVEGWDPNRPFYVEYLGDYYRVDTFTETSKKSVKPVAAPRGASQAASVQFEDLGAAINTNAVSDEVSDVVNTYWRIISDKDLEGKQTLLNTNVGYIDSGNFLVKYDQTPFAIEDMEIADSWVIEIDGNYHSLVKDGSKIRVNTDYSFKFSENQYEYWINRPDPSYTKTVSFVVDGENPPKKFTIYRLKFSDIKDFDDRIVDTEYSKFEYEKADDLTATDEPKLYMTNLKSKSNPKDLDDFRFKDRVVNIPVSSEYTANHETFKVSDGELSDIWRKNPVYCRWAYENSIGANDQPYLLNNSMIFGDHNRSANSYHPDPSRKERNLDYFYTVNSSTFSYQHHTLHVENNNSAGIDTDFRFDFAKYLGTEAFSDGFVSTTYSVDYFSYFFDRKSTFLEGVLAKNVRKYSVFGRGDSSTPNVSLFRGIKFLAYDVDSVKRDVSGQVEKINLKTSNAFEGYKLSILLTEENNGMEWRVIEKWEMDRKYQKGSVVVHDDILYVAARDTETTTPVFNYAIYDYFGGLVVLSRNKELLKSTPYASLQEIPTSWTITDTNGISVSKDWDFYENDKSVFWNPNKIYQLGDVVYSAGDYYRMSSPNGYDFWNPVRAYDNSNYGYNQNSIVIFNGEYYISKADENIQSPDNSLYWEKHNVGESECKWNRIRIWSPGVAYVANTHVVHNQVAYISGVAVSAGVEPGKIGTPWTRVYGIEQDTDFVYQPDSNPIIKMNNKLYLSMSNPNNATLENGINIYINKKWKNILVNISINDKTIASISNSDRDSMYTTTNRKLVANNFINAINDLQNRYEFTDYINYYVLDDNGLKRYSYSDGIENIPHILYAERAERLDVKVNSLDISAVDLSKLKATKSLNNGVIAHLDDLNKFNDTHLATEIEYNKDMPLVLSNYNGIKNITTNTIYRFGGGYSPLFRDIEIFKKDNTTAYNEVDLILELNKRQTVYFKYEVNGAAFERDYYINPGLSYSAMENPVYSYYGQLINIINAEPELSGVGFKFEVRPPRPSSEPKENMVLHLDADIYNGTSVWGDLGKYSNNVNLDGISYTKTDIYPGSYFTNKKNQNKCLNKISLGQNATLEAWVRRNNFKVTEETFVSIDGVVQFGLIGRSVVLRNEIGGLENILLSDDIVEDKTWYHFAFTTEYVDGKTLQRIYIDGNLNVFGTASGSQSPDSGDLLICHSNNEGTDFDGDISILRIYDRTLGQDEIMRNFLDQHSSLSVRYKSNKGDIRIKLEQVYPSLAFNIIDLTGETTRTFQMGATAGTAPYEWSVNGSEFSGEDTYVISKSVTSYNILVKDSIGLTSGAGYYTVNGFDGKTYIDGAFSY